MIVVLALATAAQAGNRFAVISAQAGSKAVVISAQAGIQRLYCFRRKGFAKVPLAYSPHPCGSPFGPPSAFNSAILPN